MKWKNILAMMIVTLMLAGAVRAADEPPKKKVLMFTKSAGFEHDVIKRKDGQLGHAEKIFTEIGTKHGFEVTATKDGSVFTAEKLAEFDAIAFYTTGDLTTEGNDKNPPMPPGGKEAFLKAIEDGKGFIGFHCASDTFHSKPPAEGQKVEVDPYLKMLGGEFIVHGEQQEATMKVIDAKFPGLEGIGDFAMTEEWYALKYFQPDIHVILVQETKGMRNPMYQRPPYPATWARMHGKGRVFFTSMGHREDVWTNPKFQQIAGGGMDWILGKVDADLTPNLMQVTPDAEPPGQLEFREKKK